MAQAYTRQSSMADGDTITAALFNNEYNQLLNAFSYSSSSASSTGHRHDGTAGQGGNIHTIGDLDFLNKIVVDSTNNRWGVFVEVSSAAVEQIRIQDGAIVPVTDNDIDLGTSSVEFKDAYFDGTVTTDALVADTADINGGTVDGATVGANSASTGAFTTLTTSGNATVGGNLTVTGTTTFNGGTITMGDAATDNVVFGADVDSHIIPDDDDTYDLGSASQQWRNLYIDGTAEIDTLAINGTTVTSTASELNILDGVTATAAEINTLDGITSTVAELNILDGVTASATDINLIDGITNGTVIASKAIITDSNKDITGGRNITISGQLAAATLDISGDVDVDGTLEADAITVNGTTLAETISDTVGAMVSSNTETNITVTYDDSDNTLDFVIGTLNQDTTGTADNITVSANNSTDETVYPIFVDGATGSQGAESDTGLTYNPSTGVLTSTSFTGNLTGNVTGNTSGTAATVTGAAQSNITSLGTLTTLTVDNVIINGTTIGHTSDTDLITLADGNVTIAGELDLTTLDVSGNADIDGTLEADAYTVNGTNLDEYIEDTVGAMLSSNTETGVTVTYEDGDSTIDFAVNAAQTGITSLLATDIKIGEDDQTKIDFETADEIHFYAANAEQVYVADGIFGPQTDSDVDLGSTSVRWKDAYVDSITTTGNAAVGGNLTLTGDLTVNGTTSTVNSTTVTIDDPIFTLGGDSAPGSDDNKDRGIEFRWHNGSAAKVGFFGYDDSASAFTFVPDATNSSEVFSGTVGNAIFGDITGTLQTAAQTNITSLGTLTALTGGTGDFNWDSNTLVVDSSTNRVGILNASPDVTLDIGSATDSIHVPVGTTAQRPGSPAAGYFRYNSTTGKFEGYTDSWGSIGGGSGTNMDTNIYAGDGSDTTFTLSTAPDNENNLMVFIDGVFQAHDTYSVSGTTLTFATAPASGRVITVYHSTTTVGGSNNTINTMTGDGSDTTLTLSVAPVHENNVQVFFDGVYQSKSNYSISGTTLTFSTAPPDDVLVEAITNTNTTSTTANQLIDADSDTLIQCEESSDEDKIRFDTGGTERMIIDSTGLGVGNSSPTEKLTLGTTSDANTRIAIQSANDGAGTIQFADGTSAAAYAGYINYTHSDNALAFATSSAEKMRLSSGGELGIGNTAPDALGSGYSGVQIGGYAYNIGHSGGDHYITNNAYHNSGWKHGKTGSAQKIQLASDAIMMRLAPSASADAAVGWSNYSYLTGTGTSFEQWVFADSGSSEGAFRLKFYSDGASAEQWLSYITMQQGSGDGAARKSEMLFGVADNGAPSTALTIANNGIVSGDLNDTSDVALKENITDLGSATAKLKQLQPRTFDWKQASKGTGVSGFIAQEVASVIPEAVVGEDYVAPTYYADGDTIPDGKEIGDTKTEGNIGKAINATAILAYAVKTIQELEARIKTLEDA